MTRSSRHKSHKQSKHSVKETKEYSDSEGEDVKMKERERGGEKEGGSGSGRVSKDSGAGEKRKLTLQLKDGGKEGKDHSGHGNVDVVEEYMSIKRRKEKADMSGTGEKWNGVGDDVEKSSKSKEKGTGESKSKSSKRHVNVGEKQENVASVVEKEESKIGNRSESKRKSEKDSGLLKEAREKERGLVTEKKGDSEVYAADADVTKKKMVQSEDFADDRQGKRSRNNTDWSRQNEPRDPEFDKEYEKRVRKRKEGSGDGDKYQDGSRGTDEKRLSSRGDRAKEGRYREEKHKEGNYGDKYQVDGGKDDRHRGEKYREDTEKDNKRRDDEYWDDGDRDSRRRDGKYLEDGDRDSRRREHKYFENDDRDSRRRNDKLIKDGERDNRRQDDKYLEDGEKEKRHREEKYMEDGDRDSRHNNGKYCENADTDGRRKDEKYIDDGDRDNRHKEEKHRDDYERESRHRDGKQADETDREKKLRDAKYKEDRASRNRSGDKSDTKYSKDETYPADLHSRKSSMQDNTSGYDDRMTRYKDDQGRRKTSDKEDPKDIRSRSTKEQLLDAETRSAGMGGVDLVTDRVRPSSRTDVELTVSHSRRQSSPSFSTQNTRDHYRFSKPDESKYRDYDYEERARHSVTSGRDYAGAGGVSEKKFLQKDDNQFYELTVERRLKSDSRNSPRQLMDKSPSSTITERRHLGRSDVRRNLDVEESGQRSAGPRNVKDYSSREGRGSREVATETLPGEEFSQPDGDSFSVSSPLRRTNSKPPPPSRLGVDSPLSFGASDDDSRGKSSSRHRRIGDPSMGRVQGNAWRGVLNWPSPIANGFMPFQHGPSPVGFHPMMQQFPTPPIFGARPSMELNHSGVHYHALDADRFSGHGRSLGWRNDSCPPVQGWDANKAVFGEQSYLFGRPEWDHGRMMPIGQSWETSGDMWKGSNMPSASERGNYLSHAEPDESLGGQSGLQAQHEHGQTDLQTETNETSQPCDAPESKTTTGITPEESPIIDDKSKRDDARLCHVYLSKLDISADLTEPDMYLQCISLLEAEDHNVLCDVDDSKILYMEEAVEAKKAIQKKNSSTVLFAAANDSVFQKAMDLHKKHKEESKVVKRGSLTLSSVENESIPKSDQGKPVVESGSPEELAVDGDGQPEKPPNVAGEIEELPASFENEVSGTANQKVVVVDVGKKEEESGFTMNSASMEVQVNSDLEARSIEAHVTSDLDATSMEVQVTSDVGDKAEELVFTMNSASMEVQVTSGVGDKVEESNFTMNSASMEVQVPSDLEARSMEAPVTSELEASSKEVQMTLEFKATSKEVQVTSELMATSKEVQVTSELAATSKEVQETSAREATDHILDEKNTVSVEIGVKAANYSPAEIEDLIKPSVPTGDLVGNKEEKNLADPKCGPSLFDDVTSEACEAMVRESIESGSVNLSRIHHSPESTH